VWVDSFDPPKMAADRGGGGGRHLLEKPTERRGGGSLFKVDCKIERKPTEKKKKYLEKDLSRNQLKKQGGKSIAGISIDESPPEEGTISYWKRSS